MSDDEIKASAKASVTEAARQARGERAASKAPAATSVAYFNREDPDNAHKKAKTKDLKGDTKLKKIFAWSFICILVGQLLVMNAVFVLVGAKVLSFEQFALNLYMSGTLAEVFGVVLIMARYLFSKRE